MLRRKMQPQKNALLAVWHLAFSHGILRRRMRGHVRVQPYAGFLRPKLWPGNDALWKKLHAE